MYCISSVCCGGERASTVSFILLFGQPVKALCGMNSGDKTDDSQNISRKRNIHNWACAALNPVISKSNGSAIMRRTAARAERGIHDDTCRRFVKRVWIPGSKRRVAKRNCYCFIRADGQLMACQSAMKHAHNPPPPLLSLAQCPRPKPAVPALRFSNNTENCSAIILIAQYESPRRQEAARRRARQKRRTRLPQQPFTLVGVIVGSTRFFSTSGSSFLVTGD
jgi:hypothetical protein